MDDALKSYNSFNQGLDTLARSTPPPSGGVWSADDLAKGKHIDELMKGENLSKALKANGVKNVGKTAKNIKNGFNKKYR